ncbi:MAG: DUF882 domain-containing protein [Myxococcota bacterium]|jgi:uncharacterized protein YcbK (DUF882 family)|nr:DUF882 domain-containing protein [Myxococcota bacterium]
MRRARALTAALAGLALTGALVYSASSHAPAAVAAPVKARPAAPPPAPGPPPELAAYASLPALEIYFVNTRRSEKLRLYDAFGQVDEAAAKKLDELLGDTHERKHYVTTRLDRRTLQLLFRAAYHFQAGRVEVISAYRKPGRKRQGYHGTGQAIDFKLDGVPAAKLASYLRTLPRAGVGIYTHPRTQFVHLDSRQTSFHWLDGSPPGRSWRERSIGGKGLPQQDAVYSRRLDWPEGLAVPQVPFEP